MSIDDLIDDPTTRVIVCCGSGGVGKTTTSAALAIRAAERGRTVVVLTIDPAKRLAQALGLKILGNEPDLVEGVGTDGSLHAMMLDMRRTFDEMVEAHAEPGRAEKILANPFYQTISTSFSGTQEYMAMEKLGQLAATEKWDLIVVDTPPSRSALDFLDAPQRMSKFLDGRMIRLLSAPARAGGRGLRKIVGAGFTLFAKAVSTILGGQMLADASAFVQAFDTMFGGFRERATATYELLRSPGTAFLVVAAPEPDALREAAYFVDRLSTEEMPLAGMVLNRTHPVLADLSASQARAAADGLRGAPLAAAVLRLHADRVDLAAREERLLARFTKAHGAVPVTRVPVVPSVGDLDGLREIGAPPRRRPRPAPARRADGLRLLRAGARLPAAAALAAIAAGDRRFGAISARCGRSRQPVITPRRAGGGRPCTPGGGRATGSGAARGARRPRPRPLRSRRGGLDTALAACSPATRRVGAAPPAPRSTKPHDPAAAHAVLVELRLGHVEQRGVVRGTGVGQELGPDSDVGPPPQQRPPLPLRHPAPDPELDPLVECVREALGAHRADAAEAARLPLFAPGDEEVLGVGRAATRRTTPVPS